MIFNPDSKRQYLLQGGIDLLLNTRFDPSRPTGNIAQHQLADVVRAWLTGLKSEVSPALPRILDWLGKAINAREEFGQSASFHQMTLVWAKAIAVWMLTSVDDVHAWHEARNLCEGAMEEGAFDASSIPTDRLDDYLAFCVLSGSYERGIAEYDRYHVKPDFPNLQSVKPRDFGYLVCKERLVGCLPSSCSLDLGQTMLRDHLQDQWLGQGQILRAATWLKIVYADSAPKLDAEATLLRAYDNMPKVRRPRYVP